MQHERVLGSYTIHGALVSKTKHKRDPIETSCIWIRIPSYIQVI